MGPLLPGWPRGLVVGCALLLAPATAPAAQQAPDGSEDRARRIGELSKEGLPRTDRVAIVMELLRDELDTASFDAIVRSFPEGDRRELVLLLERVLRDSSATPREWSNAARLAEIAPDPSLAPALLDRLGEALSRDPGRAGDFVKALRAALESLRRQVAELEAERLAQASAEACVAQLDHAASEVRRAALRRLLELAQRKGDPPDDAFDRALERARDRVVSRAAQAARAAAEPLSLAPDELRLLLELAAALAPEHAEAKASWLAWFRETRDVETRLALLPALRRIVRDRPDATIAAELARQLAQEGSDEPRQPLVEAELDLLAAVGDESTLEAVAPWLAAEGAARVRLRQKAVAAIAELARRSADRPFARRVIDLLTRVLREDLSGDARLSAALGLALVVESIAERPREGTPIAALDVENLGRVFDGLRMALRETSSDRALSEQCCKTLCRIPGRATDAARVLAETLASEATAAPVREVLLRGLKELGEPEAVATIVASLTRGGPAVEPDTVGKEAYAALLAVLRRASESGRGVAAELDVVAACLAANEPEWALQFAGQLLDGVDEADRPDHESTRGAIRVAFGRAALRARSPETLERAWGALDAAVDDPSCVAAQRQDALLLLLEVAERTRPLHAAEAAARAEQLLEEPELAATERADVVRRGAALWLVAGRWASAYGLLDRELVETEAPADLIVLKARAAVRREDPEGPRDALRIHEALVGARGRGGRLAADAGDRPALVLALAQIYVTNSRSDDARAALRTLPPEERLPPELRDEVRQLARLLSG